MLMSACLLAGGEGPFDQSPVQKIAERAAQGFQEVALLLLAASCRLRKSHMLLEQTCFVWLSACRGDLLQQALVSKLYSACAGIFKLERLPTDRAQASPHFW